MRRASGETARGLRVLIGGGSGFIGKSLTPHLTSQGHAISLISRTKNDNTITWGDIETSGLPPCDAVVNLAGANLMGQLRWTQEYRQQVWNSRVGTNKAIARAIAQMKREDRPKVFLSSSAVGFYPTGVPGPEVDEDYTPRADSWFGELTEAWENAADEANGLTRVVKLRTAVVLGPNGGALASMLPAFKFGLGNVMGDGGQYFPWIHIDDIVGIIEHSLLHDNVSGILNGVAPETRNAQEFAECLAQTMGTTVKFHTPEFVVKAIFGAERARILFEGHKVIPKRTLKSGYTFKFPHLQEALTDVLSKM